MKEVYVLGLHWGSHSVAPFYVIHFLNGLASVIALPSSSSEYDQLEYELGQEVSCPISFIQTHQYLFPLIIYSGTEVSFYVDQAFLMAAPIILESRFVVMDQGPLVTFCR